MRSRCRWIALLALPWLASACADKSPMGRSADFVRRARSARLTVFPKAQGSQPRQVEIHCPDRVRVVTSTPAGALEFVAVGNRAFSRTADDSWRSVPLSFVNAPPVCAGSTWRPDSADLPRVFREMRRLPATEGARRAVSGVPCQEWQVRRERPVADQRQLTHVNLCLGVDDARPMLMEVGEEVWAFTEWNGSVTIDEPKIVPQASPASSPKPSAGPGPGAETKTER